MLNQYPHVRKEKFSDKFRTSVSKKFNIYFTFDLLLLLEQFSIVIQYFLD